MALEIVGRCLPLAVRGEIVAVGDHRLEIDESKIAVDIPRHAAQALLEAERRAVLHESFRRDLGAFRVEAGVAHQHQREPVGTRRLGRRSADRSGIFGAGAGLDAERTVKRAAAGSERKDRRCGAQGLREPGPEQAAPHESVGPHVTTS